MGGRQAKDKASKEPREKFKTEAQDDPRPTLGRGRSSGVGFASGTKMYNSKYHTR